ncbi:MAG: type III pantothenate kinase, partial [Vicingaceae bacterium]
PVPIKSLYSSPETLGHDRIALAVAGSEKFPNCNTLIIDIGTCMTMDLVDSSGTYHGGAISPGMELRFRSMHEGTSRLPLVDFASKKLPDQIGKTTRECMESGVILGMAHEIRGTIKELNKEFEDLKVLLTGGQHHLFEVPLKNSIFADPNLVLRGLNHILLYNLP